MPVESLIEMSLRQDRDDARRALDAAVDEVARVKEQRMWWRAECEAARSDAADVRAYAARLEAALVRAHACPTVRDDGDCDGCYISEALATCSTVPDAP